MRCHVTCDNSFGRVVTHGVHCTGWLLTQCALYMYTVALNTQCALYRVALKLHGVKCVLRFLYFFIVL